jgi:hypothetical protein
MFTIRKPENSQSIGIRGENFSPLTFGAPRTFPLVPPTIPSPPDRQIRDARKPFPPGVERRRLIDPERLVRSKGRIDPGPDPQLLASLMVRERIGRIADRIR